MKYSHIPVMLEEVVVGLHLKPGSIVIDATLGGAGYTKAISDAVSDKGHVLAIDADLKAIRNATLQLQKFKFQHNVTLVHDNFRNLKKITKKNNVDSVDACVFDLGLSSAQLEDTSRGFSFKLAAPLVMEFEGLEDSDVTKSKTYQLVNFIKQAELEKIIRDYGEEKYAGRIARAIIKNRPITTTDFLADIISNAVPNNYEHGRLHPATRTFQALRIATNDEMGALTDALSQAVALLKSGGRLVVVSFHSLEDREVKTFFKHEATDCICPSLQPICTCEHKAQLKIITKKPLVPTDKEIKNNIRARSAKLRIAEKI